VIKGYLKFLIFLLWFILKTVLVKKEIYSRLLYKKRFVLPVKFNLLSDEALSIYITKLNGITTYQTLLVFNYKKKRELWTSPVTCLANDNLGLL